jgi:hypothetical protein
MEKGKIIFKKPEIEMSPEMRDLIKEIQNTQESIVVNVSKQMTDLMDQKLRETLKDVVPPIKGEITKGKLRWRGLRLIQKDEPNGRAFWIEQRGKLIGERHLILYPWKTQNLAE